MIHPLASVSQKYTLKGCLVSDTNVTTTDAQGNWQIGNPALDLRIEIIERASTNPVARANYGIDINQALVRCFVVSVKRNGVMFPPNAFQIEHLNKELWSLDDRVKYTIVESTQSMLVTVQQVFGKQFLAIKEVI